MVAPTLRQEPYRIFFPLGIILAAAGVVPWLLFARGVLPTWPGLPHALVMSQGFFVAIAIGFLGTMLPRRTQSEPFSGSTLGFLGLAIVGSSAAQLAGLVIVAEALYLACFMALAAAALRRAKSGSLPPSFVLIPVGALLGATGAALLVASAAGAPEVTLRLGRALVAQGALLGMVLGVVPFLGSALLRGAPAARPGTRAFYVGVAVVLAASFVLDELIAPSVGLGARALLAGVIVVGSGALDPTSKSGAHRAFFRLALLLVPIGLAAASLAPERRVALLHITYGGGFALLVLAVTVHVGLMHGGGERVAETWPAPIVIAAALALAAVAVRACLEGFGAHYLDAMAIAAVLWLGAVAAWGAFLAPHLLRRARP